MFHRSLIISLTLTLGLLVFSQFTQAQTPSVTPTPPAAQTPSASHTPALALKITSLKLAGEAVCPTTSETDCVTATWAIQPPPSNFSGLSYEVSGQMTYESGSSTNNGTPVNDGKATSALVKFFHSGSGSVKAVKITVKLFQQEGPLGRKKLLSEDTQTQRF